MTHEQIDLMSGASFAIEATSGSGEFTRFDYIEFSPVDTPEATPPAPNSDATLAEAGISQETIDYLSNSINPEQTEAVFEDPAFVNTLNAIRSSDAITEGAVEITSADQLWG